MFNLVPFQRRMQVPQAFNEVDTLFERFFNEPFILGFSQNMGDLNLKVDIRDNENEYILEADLPSVNKENLQVEFEDNVLTIAVEQNEQVKEEKENYIRHERRQQSISRRFAFDNVEGSGIQAKYENGVLTVNLPKSKIQDQKHHIEIQ